MKVSDLIEQLQAFDQKAEICMQINSGTFVSPVWVGIMDTAGLFDDENDFQLVVSPWEPEDYRKPENIASNKQ